jgi:outer membrane protein OmpA-like peptidoglycan-associated protein
MPINEVNMVTRRLIVSMATMALLGSVAASSVHAADDGLSESALREALLGTTGAPSAPTLRGIQAGGDDDGMCSAGICRDIKIEFANNKYTLSSKAKSNLDTLASVLKDAEGKGWKFEISGHTNATGPAGHNDWLSQKRADAVAAYLAQDKEIPKSMLEAVGFGSKEPLPGLDPKNGKNRRVQVKRVDG